MWNLTRDVYSVKSGYQVAMEEICPSGSSSTDQTSSLQWKLLWNAPSIPRSKELVCPWRGLNRETVFHALVLCPHARLAWFASSLGITYSGGEECFGNWFQSMFLASRNKEAIGLTCEITWAIWSSRNMKTFNNKELDMRQIINLANSMHLDLKPKNSSSPWQHQRWPL
ncbi:hypothetical protein RIF29_20604 [Crotalaria pallida]|uniref:Reverse transcriptase zinc-binding domain-containing protein n=1 Tax=Crotalaria pallida TaxID=3830 RepID=A0AAN9I580_CROPI